MTSPASGWSSTSSDIHSKIALDLNPSIALAVGVSMSANLTQEADAETLAGKFEA